MAYSIDGAHIPTDEEGYLLNLDDWSKALAEHIARADNLFLTSEHWEVLTFLRSYYAEFRIAPAVRVLTRAVAKALGADKGNSRYLYELFPRGPAKQACKIAGLPKPTGCV